MKKSLATDFINGQGQARSLYGVDFEDEALRIKKIKVVSKRSLSPDMVALLREQNAQLRLTPARKRYLLALEHPNSVFVITGQQVGLFLGPIFTLYKALTAIKVAQALEAATAIPTIPLFWLQTEDHDFQEINHCHLPDPEHGFIKLEVSSEAGFSERVPIANRFFGETIQGQLELLERKLGHFPHSQYPLQTLKQCYQPTSHLGDAFKQSLGEFLAEEGLLFFQPRSPVVSSLAQPVFEKAYASREAVHMALRSQGEKIVAAGYSEQISLRGNSPLFFYHDQTTDERFRLEKQGSSWQFIGDNRAIADEELQQVISSKPFRLSSSALLRPLLQDSLFPCAAYIAGPAEMSYFSQLAPLYEMFGLEKPLLVPRASFVLLDQKSREWLSDLQLKVPDLMLPDEELAKRVLAKTQSGYPSPASLMSSTKAKIHDAFLDMNNAFAALDKTLADSLEKSKEKIFNQVYTLEGRYAKALLAKESVNEDRLKRLKASYFPMGVEQERFFGVPYFLCRYGEELKNELSKQLQPFSGTQQEIIL